MADPGTCIDCALDAALSDAVVVSQEAQVKPAPAATNGSGESLLDPATFVPPKHPIAPSVTIEFCNRCRWLHRAMWTSTELMLTFPPSTLSAVSVMPLDTDETGGRFRVWLHLPANPAQPSLVWDRKIEGGFPELKILKQRIRDHIQPGHSLGHSDKP